MVRVALGSGNRGEVGWCTRLAGRGRRNGGDIICGAGRKGEGGRDGKVSGTGTNMTVSGLKDGVCRRACGSAELE